MIVLGVMAALWLVAHSLLTSMSVSPYVRIPSAQFTAFATVADANAYLQAHLHDTPGSGTTLPRLSLPSALPSTYTLSSISVAPGLTTIVHLVYATGGDSHALTLDECSLCSETDAGTVVPVGAFIAHLTLHPGLLIFRQPVAELSWMAGTTSGYRLVLQGDATGQQALAIARSLA